MILKLIGHLIFYATYVLISHIPFYRVHECNDYRSVQIVQQSLDQARVFTS